MITTRRRGAVLLALLLAGGLAAGCGSDGDGDDAVASLDESAAEGGSGSGEGDGGGDQAEGPRASPEFQDAMLEYAQCMRDQGVDMPDPEFDDGLVRMEGGPGPNGATEEEWEAADAECQPILEDAAPDVQMDPEQQAEMQDQMVEVAECMRERGHDMPDPEVDEDGRVQVRVQGPPGGEGGGPDAEFEADMAECSDEAGAPQMGGGGG